MFINFMVTTQKQPFLSDKIETRRFKWYSALHQGIPELLMNTTSTTIKLSRGTKERLDNLKEYERETYEEILCKILGVLNICKINPEKARARLISVDRQKKRRTRQPRIYKKAVTNQASS